jgi:hypothetical protein
MGFAWFQGILVFSLDTLRRPEASCSANTAAGMVLALAKLEQ